MLLIKVNERENSQRKKRENKKDKTAIKIWKKKTNENTVMELDIDWWNRPAVDRRQRVIDDRG